MPSGAKRRKAAKKKQEKIAHITENQPVNGDSSRSQDEKDSDSSSVSSPTTSQHSRNPLRKNDNNNNTDDDKSDTAGSASDEPRDVSKSKERSQFDEVEVTKEVDFESRVVKIDDAKEEEESESSNGGIQVVEKKIDVVPTQIEEEKELIESKEVEKVEKDIPVSVIEPIKEAVEEVSQPEGVIEAVEINIVEKTGGSGVIDAQSGDRELPESNGTSVDTVNGSGDTVQSCISTNSDNEKKDIVPVLPPTVRPTSWKSCCGLFDVFGGSNR